MTSRSSFKEIRFRQPNLCPAKRVSWQGRGTKVVTLAWRDRLRRISGFAGLLFKEKKLKN
jgi:hypothetical protein